MDFLYSMGQGYMAQAGASEGGRGAAGFGAALIAPVMRRHEEARLERELTRSALEEARAQRELELANWYAERAKAVGPETTAKIAELESKVSRYEPVEMTAPSGKVYQVPRTHVAGLAGEFEDLRQELEARKLVDVEFGKYRIQVPEEDRGQAMLALAKLEGRMTELERKGELETELEKLKGKYKLQVTEKTEAGKTARQALELEQERELLDKRLAAAAANARTRALASINAKATEWGRPTIDRLPEESGPIPQGAGKSITDNAYGATAELIMEEAIKQAASIVPSGASSEDYDLVVLQLFEAIATRNGWIIGKK
jgi:hypothetical protein